MDFSFSFMQGIMGNTIQQPPQLIDSANIRQDGTCDTGSDPGEDGGPSYDAALDADFYPHSASEDLPHVSNGYPPGLGIYEPQSKFSMYSQFPNGSANGYGPIRSYAEHGLLMPGESTVLRGPGLQERPRSPVSPPLPTHHPHLHHHHHHHHLPHAHHFLSNTPHIQSHPQSPPPLPLPTQHHLPHTPHIMTHTLPPPPPLHLPSSSPPPSLVDSTPSSQPVHPPPSASTGVLKKTSSPEIKLKIIKTYQNGKELFETALCGDLLQELQKESQQKEAAQVQRRHERKKEKRKKSAKLQLHIQEQNLDPVQGQAGTTGQTEDTYVQPLPREPPTDQTEKPQKTVIQTEPKVPKVNQPSVIQETGFCKEFVIGDLVWSKVGTYPWWPCMVSSDPQMKVHTRINTRGHREYHVQFFGSVAERAWIHEKRIVVYQGKQQFDELQADTLRKTTNTVEKHKLLKPIPQRERAQWEVGVGHAEDAFLMTRQERIDNYTFIYVDPVPNETPIAKKPVGRPEKRNRRSSGSTTKKDDGGVKSPEREQPPRRQLPRRQCSISNPDDNNGPNEKKNLRGDQSKPDSPQRDNGSDAGAKQDSPPPVRAWKTAAARKLLPLSITMKRLNVEITKCDWPLLQKKMAPSPKKEVEKDEEEEEEVEEERVEGEGRQPDLGYCSPEQENRAKPEPSPEEDEDMDDMEEEGEERRESPASRRSEEGGTQPTSSPGSHHSSPHGSQERKLQRRSVRSRSESERGNDPVPKKKTKKEQAEMAPEATPRAGSQKGASEISDACKPLKKRSRASTDVEMASSQYRDTSDSDSRGLNDPQGLFGKSLDSPAAADADASDTQSVDSGLSRQDGSTGKRDTVCQICEVYGENLVVCEGDCNRQFHLECLGLTSLPEGRFTCLECRNGNHQCFSCKKASQEVTRCSVTGCGCYYHEDCVRKLPGTTNNTGGAFICPQHSCATCCLERDLQRASKGRLMRCIRCPVAYHTGDSCVAAGSAILTHHIMICSSHGSTKKNGLLTSPVNVGWCFLCARGLLVQDLTDTILSSYAYKSHYLLTESNRAELKLPMIPSPSSATKKNVGKGGKLLCCDSCPASFHPECLEMEMPEGPWSCSDCRAGKKPHYKQIVWVKLGNYRWWPAEICNPRLVPSNIQSLRHDIGDFPVFFFGSHDYYWINQGRVFPYVENDKNFVTGQININKTFKKALEEAARRFQELKAQRESREALEQERNSRKPPPYKFIKSNKPVGKVHMHVADLSEIPRCNCRPADEHPCSLDSQCLNRMLQYECHPQVCPAGENCENQCFSKRLYAETEVIKTEDRGWGLRTNQALRKGDFVTEYVGEVIDSDECQQRIKRAHENHVTNFYMLTLTKDRVIDAGPKGNSSRFINHSCSPNCETQKWTVNGDVRIGLFALCDIEAGTEMTFNYNLHCVGNRRTSCHCGSDNCSGFLGVQPTSAVVQEKEEKARNAKLRQKKRKLRLEGKHTHEYFCFCCGEGGELVMCDRKECPKAYHLLCLNLTKPPYGRWECPWHDCSICGTPASSLCDFCPRSFCPDHEAGALTASSLESRPCCSSHNPLSPLASSPSSAQPPLPLSSSSLSPVTVKEEPQGDDVAPSLPRSL
ncbi:histone-lysine N-methyltransferase NSD3 isoform X1 [Hippocampus zosterae]|uniref:histone-lysine N-methyltransferase NSD3 isoform X1 n=1 Tax=Hippocampus zosterae TaxID=109293 RepID=UPI00223D104B|nr:histone-lysine N-methyltransferase NSD3 isoform X1 [Hippocampus zosterae]XP_051923077.1 histone-lysine N-methyltransferase NSD3 isoform X1 [Hippocampus zosterae]XP_051923078.1 histone-lysine N-methyltransferase NSD3 isoform X1 [Hippocampus zosterae]